MPARLGMKLNYHNIFLVNLRNNLSIRPVLNPIYMNRDTDVLVAINEHGLYVIDPTNVVILLGLKHEELSWDYAKPSQVRH